jgi:hypothetical protein
VPLAFQQLCKKGARRPRTQDKDSHSASKLYHTPKQPIEDSTATITKLRSLANRGKLKG